MLIETATALLDDSGRPASFPIGELRQDLESLERDASAGDGGLVTAEQAGGSLVEALDH